jgi:hypothetical protein
MFRRILTPIVLFLSAILTAEAQSLQEMVPIPDDNGARPQILNGEPAERTDWPVTLRFQSGGGYCTSTIIGERVVITAAHCVDNAAKAKVLFNNAWTEVTCFHHQRYKGPSCHTATTTEEIAGCTADVALCRASQPFKLVSDSGVAIRLESINRDPALLQVNATVMLLGYGCLEPGGPITDTLQIGKATIKSISVPGASSDPMKTMQEYMVAQGGAAVCQGDSGGSAFNQLAAGARKIIGLNSRGNISTLSYLTSTSDKHILDFLESWGPTPICGVHSNAKGC